MSVRALAEEDVALGGPGPVAEAAGEAGRQLYEAEGVAKAGQVCLIAKFWALWELGFHLLQLPLLLGFVNISLLVSPLWVLLDVKCICAMSVWELSLIHLERNCYSINGAAKSGFCPGG